MFQSLVPRTGQRVGSLNDFSAVVVSSLLWACPAGINLSYRSELASSHGSGEFGSL